MSTSASAIDPNDPRLTEVKHRPFIHPDLTTTQQKYLSSIGLHQKAQRLADIKRLRKWYRASDDNSDAWQEGVFTSMMRTEPYFAERQAGYHEEQFSAFVDHIEGEWFTQANFYFLSETTTLNDPAHQNNQRTVRLIREIIGELAPKAIDKYVAFDGTLPKKKVGEGTWNRRIKVIFSSVVDPEKMRSLIRSLPAGVVVNARTEHKSHFTCTLHTWAMAGFLGNVKERADMELSLEGLQQVGLHGFQVEERGQFALDKKENASLPLTFEDLETKLLPISISGPQKYIPRSPWTGKLARFESAIVDCDVKVDDLAPEEWDKIPSSA